MNTVYDEYIIYSNKINKFHLIIIQHNDIIFIAIYLHIENNNNQFVDHDLAKIIYLNM